MASEREIVHIYAFYFPTSDKYYVGQTCDIKRRISDHIKGRTGKNLPIHNAINKYDDWIVTPLHVCYTRDDADRVEIEEIRNFNSITPNGYNLTAGGEGGDTFTNNPNKEEARAKISAAGKELGRKQRAETVKNTLGKTYGTLYVVEYLPEESTNKRDKYRCVCVCGNEKNIWGLGLRSGSTKSCGCSLRRATVEKMVGETFHQVYVIKYLPEASKGVDQYLCRCSCGNEKIIRGPSLRNGQTKSCGCYQRMKTVNKMLGQTFGRLYVVEYVPDIESRSDWYRCSCTCGGGKVVRGISLRSGNTKSCGCIRHERMTGDNHPMRQPEIVAKNRVTKKIKHIKKLRAQIKELEANSDK